MEKIETTLAARQSQTDCILPLQRKSKQKKRGKKTATQIQSSVITTVLL